MRFLKRLLGILPLRYASAHCDVPCGIYDPKIAQIGAATVLRMVKLIGEMPKDNPTVNERNKFVRCVLTKEEHARICKKEILILWTDYFKPEHLEKFPELHDLIWKTAKLCSQNKQNVDENLAQQLVDSVNKISDIFDQSKSA